MLLAMVLLSSLIGFLVLVGYVLQGTMVVEEETVSQQTEVYEVKGKDPEPSLPWEKGFRDKYPIDYKEFPEYTPKDHPDRPMVDWILNAQKRKKESE